MVVVHARSPPDRDEPRHWIARDDIQMKATLALENGLWYEGQAAGAAGETGGEVVFNTSMTGYQEVLTDPSYAGQIVAMTAPEMGNYGVAPRRPRIARRRRSPGSSSAKNRRSPATGAPTARCATTSSRNNIVAISDIDTRALTRRAAVGRRHARHHRHRRGRSARAGRSRAGAAADGGIGSGPRRHLRARVRLDADAGCRGRVRAAAPQRRAPATCASRRTTSA